LLAEEVVKIVIAVICISLLVYLLFSLYYKNKDSKDLEIAKASLNYLIEEINLGKTEVTIYNPDGWTLLSWPYTDSKDIIIPKSCSNAGWTSCICLCKTPNRVMRAFYPIRAFSNKCDSIGACLDNTKSIQATWTASGESPVLINVPMTLEIDQNKVIREKLK